LKRKRKTKNNSQKNFQIKQKTLWWKECFLLRLNGAIIKCTMKTGKIKMFLVFLITIFTIVDVFSYANNAARADDSVGDTQDAIKSTEKELGKKQQVLNVANSNYAKVAAQVNTTASLLTQTTQEIARKEAEIKNLSDRVILYKTMLSAYLQEMYFGNQDPVIKLAVANENLDAVFGNEDQMLNVKEKILGVLDEINVSQEKLGVAKEELADEKQQHGKLLQQKKAEQGEIVEDIQETRATIAELQNKLAKLKTDLNRILGKAYDTGEIKDAIKFANKVTGVREGCLFGMLSMESGGNPLAGRCTYKNCDMTSARKKKFNEICGYLDYDTKKCEKMPLSCASKSYPGSGGAMGAAQFMSDTWMGYKNRIANAIVDSKPNPWELLDGVVAMALYLDDLGATKSGTVSIKNPCTGKSVKVKWEIYASMRYLGWTCWGYTNYAPGIQSLANGYKNL